MTAILGISAFYHDSAACLVVDGEVVAAAQEERFSREKYDPAFPEQAIRYCLAEGGLDPGEIDYVAFYEKPLGKFERLIETYLSYAPHGLKSFNAAMPVWLKKKLFMRNAIRRGCGIVKGPLVFLDHHESHAASAFFPSPFEDAAILTLDGVGEWSTACIGSGAGNKIRITHELRFPHSLGLLYSAFTYYCGFKVNSGEYKLMGLAPYGRPVYADLIRKRLVDLKPDGSLWMNMQYFGYCDGLTMTNGQFEKLFGGPPRRPDSALEQRHMDLAASVQAVTEECVLRMARDLHRQTKMKRLVLAGGVALNCVANGRLLREGPFESIWIQPAAGDAGGALGAAQFVWHQLLDKPRTVNGTDGQKGSLLGPRFSPAEVRQFLAETGAAFHGFGSETELLDHVAQLLDEGKVVGWFQGRAEYGPRALGARSILGDARSPQMQAIINLKIKFRESFRPFAPAVLREHVHEWFGMEPGSESPYMLLVAPVLDRRRLPLSSEDAEVLRHDPDLVRRVNVARSTVPAITHVDYSARVQTVDERHGAFHRLLKRFHARTGCPVLVNTSFNLSWEPIVLTPKEAYHTFMQSEMDALVLEDCVLHKSDQPVGLRVAVSSPEGPPDPSSPWADPVTGDPLILTASCARNPTTGTCYPVIDGIPRLFVPTRADEADSKDVTTPFPNYDDLDTPRALVEKSRDGLFARLLNEQIPYGARVVEVGCGTGHLTNYLSVPHRTVLGVDVCLNSLRLAHRFKTDHGLERATFAQMNLFRPGLRNDFFDVVISNGVLHHTSDCRGAFRRISRLAKPGGYIVIGHHSAYSRKLDAARRAWFQWTGLTSRWRDPHLGRHETSHSLGEVLRWMDEDGIEFINSIPKPTVERMLSSDEILFERRDRGTAVSRMASQLANLHSGYREGGFFVMIGQRRTGGDVA